MSRLSARAAEQIDHSAVERRDIAGLTARHPVAILHELPIDPVAPGIADVVISSQPNYAFEQSDNPAQVAENLSDEKPELQRHADRTDKVR